MATEPTEQPASPVCYADEAGDAYAGYATRDELVSCLNALLEAERAGARITAHMAVQAEEPGLSALMRQIHDDEARWCTMLLECIETLNGQPSPRVGDFCEKCLAIEDLNARAAFINRGQGWVVRKLREILPRVRSDELHARLSAMLKSHEENIVRTSALLPP